MAEHWRGRLNERAIDLLGQRPKAHPFGYLRIAHIRQMILFYCYKVESEIIFDGLQCILTDHNGKWVPLFGLRYRIESNDSKCSAFEPGEWILSSRWRKNEIGQVASEAGARHAFMFSEDPGPNILLIDRTEF